MDNAFIKKYYFYVLLCILCYDDTHQGYFNMHAFSFRMGKR